MATRSLGTLTLDLIAKIGGFTQGLTDAERVADRKMRDIERKSKQRAKEIEKAWATMGKVIVAGFAGISVVGMFGKMLTETRQMGKEQAQLGAVLRSTGEAAGWSQAQLNAMAESMSRDLKIVSSGEINQAQTSLLAFTGIVGEEFPRALQAALDMSARTGMSVVSAAETIGRALDVPSQGLAALSRQGFRFTEDQKRLAQQLEATGRTAEAQGIILQALEESYGGAARAAGNEFDGALKGLQNELANLMTGKQGSLQGAADAINDLTKTLASSEVQAAFNGLITLMSNTIVVAAKLAGEFAVMGEIIGRTAASWTGNLGLADQLKGELADIDRALNNSWLHKPTKYLFTSEDELRARRAAIEQELKALGELRTLPTPDMLPGPTNAPPIVPIAPGGAGGKPAGRDPAAAALLRQQQQQLETARRYLVTLEDQILQVNNMTNAERLRHDLMRGTVVLSGEQLSQAEGMATLLDMRTEREREVEIALNRQNAQLAAQRQLRALVMGYDADIAGVGMGDRRREEMQARLQLQQQFADRAQAIDDQRRQALATADDKNRARIEAMYADLLAIEQDFQAQSLTAYEEYIINKRAADADWTNGAVRAWQNYVDEAKTAAEVAENAMSSWLASSEDALVKFVQTGELSFGEFTRSILADLARIAARQATMGIFSSLMSGWMGTSIANQSSDPLGSFVRLNGWADGGYTGPGGKHAVAGIVHAGEGVFSQRDIAALGGPAGFERLRHAIHNGYADGGYVGRVPAAAMHAAGGDMLPGGVIVNIHGASAPPETRSRVDGNGTRVIDVFLKEVKNGIASDIASGIGGITTALRARYVMTPRR